MKHEHSSGVVASEQSCSLPVAALADAPVAAPARPIEVVVLVPAYNEAAKITETITALAALKQAAPARGIRLRIYVVNDGSKDDTARLARAAGADRVVQHKLNQGLGAAIRTGLAAARTDHAEIIVKFDADLQHDPEDVWSIIQPVLDDEADIVYGNRFLRIEYRMPFVRRVGNVVFTRLMAWLTHWPLEDSQPGIFAVNRSYFSNFYLPGDYNYTQQILLDAYHRGMRFAHVPVAFRKRLTGKSFVSLSYPLRVLPQILMVLIGVKPMRVFAPFGIFFLSAAVLTLTVELGLWLMGETDKPVVHVNALLGCLTLGLHSLFFGALADLIVRLYRR
jgi:glycosyltransferase involved in cell wall biosynthesis